MGLYDRHILPRLLDLACGLDTIKRQRQKVVPKARGEVLEVGIGSGLNLDFYDWQAVSKVHGLEPAAEIRERAGRRIRTNGHPVELLDAGAQEIPLANDSVDTVLVTYTLCTIPQVETALEEMRRVLRADGQLIFCEHGRAPDEGVRKWQDRITPLWKRVSGGCHLNRDIPELLGQGGFEITTSESMYLPGWRPAGWNVWGTARARS